MVIATEVKSNLSLTEVSDDFREDFSRCLNVCDTRKVRWTTKWKRFPLLQRKGRKQLKMATVEELEEITKIYIHNMGEGVESYRTFHFSKRMMAIAPRKQWEKFHHARPGDIAKKDDWAEEVGP